MGTEAKDNRDIAAAAGTRRWSDGEHPGVILADIASRPSLAGHVITFANEKGGVGKSTLAFHCAIALAHAGHRVVALDLDWRQSTLDRGLSFREGTVRILGTGLPMPAHAVLTRPCTAQLYQELARLDARADYIVLDAPGADCPIFRRAVAMADTLVTPVNASFIDLQALGQVDPVSGRAQGPSCFADTVAGLRRERERRGRGPIDWVVAKNRVRNTERRHIGRIDAALATLSQHHDFRVGEGLAERVAFRELFQFGLTHLDLELLPEIARAHPGTLAELEKLLGSLALDPPRPARRIAPAAPRARSSPRTRAAYREALVAVL
ncbi:division plane positioning ATPase MipZ [Pelagerythrobacter sp.]|uniref:division plane positioning ATPase MipZ n=1 Tax=Pelagerythrobacter sp. TaxID=2800702 RepID=UPI0035B4BCD4